MTIQNAVTVTLGSDLPYAIGASAYSNPLVLKNGAALSIAGNLTANSYVDLGGWGSSAINQSAGTFHVTSFAGRVDFFRSGNGAYQSVYNLSGGKLDIDINNVILGYTDTNANSRRGTLHVSGTGRFEFQDASVYQWTLRVSGGSVACTGTYKMHSGVSGTNMTFTPEIHVNGSGATSIAFATLNAYNTAGSAILRFTLDSAGVTPLTVTQFNGPRSSDQLIVDLSAYDANNGREVPLVLWSGWDNSMYASDKVMISGTPLNQGPGAVASVEARADGLYLDIGTSTKTFISEEDEEQYWLWKQTFSNFPVDTLAPWSDGLAINRFSAPPAPYVHPRIFFNPEDLPDIRNRIANTVPGQQAFAGITTFLAGNASDADYQSLLAGNTNQVMNTDQVRVASLRVMYESFRCLINEDAVGGANAAKALATLAAIIQSDFDTNGIANLKWLEEAAAKWPSIVEELPGLKDWQGAIQDRVGHMNLGLAYDCVYNWMDSTQRATVRKMISTATAGAYSHGMGLAGLGTHNWVPFHLHHGILGLAIEGEEGYDPKVTQWSIHNMRNYYTYGVHESGTPHERQGKGSVSAYLAVPFTKRGVPMLTIPNLRKFGSNYMLNMMDPWGSTCMVYGPHGGTGKDMAVKYLGEINVLKYAYPNDPVIDFVYRNVVRDDYSGSAGQSVSHHYASYQDLLLNAVFAENISSTNSWQAHLDSLNAPKTMLCPQRALFIARSKWAPDALQFFMHVDQLYSAHYKADYGQILLTSHGRQWTYYPSVADSAGALGSIANGAHYSVVLIDDVGGEWEKTHMIDKAIADDASFAASDLSYTYNWYNWVDLEEGEPVPPQAKLHGNQPNQWFQPLYEPSYEIPGMQAAQQLGAGWQQLGINANTRRIVMPRFPVEYIYRTAGLVRGTHPYVLVVDDVKKDQSVHEYKWQLIMQPDTEIESISGNDIVVKELAGNRRLLVRILQAEGSGRVRMERLAGFGWSSRLYEQLHGNRLVISRSGVEPKFKILLYPFQSGDALPATTWAGNDLSVSWSGQSDLVNFARRSDGRSSVTVTRGGTRLMQIGGN